MSLACQDLWQAFKDERVTFFTGVPDSTFKPWMSFLAACEDPAMRHIIATNEGEATAIACGYHLATGEIPVVYMQNSGLGNAVNPLVSLADSQVYAIPLILMIGWRGEPDRHDEPQHLKMGGVLLPILQDMGIPYTIIGPSEGNSALIVGKAVIAAREQSCPQALIIRHGVFKECVNRQEPETYPTMSRESAIRALLGEINHDDVIVATTGKTARELFELRETLGQGHSNDFLSVGSMGFASAIALGIALNAPNRAIWVIDGDGAALMHSGNLATIGHYAPQNLRHVILDNHTHDSTGGQPTVSPSVDFATLAKANGYCAATFVQGKTDFLRALRSHKETRGPSMITVCVRPGAREDLGRPTIFPTENKRDLMEVLRGRHKV